VKWEQCPVPRPAAKSYSHGHHLEQKEPYTHNMRLKIWSPKSLETGTTHTRILKMVGSQMPILMCISRLEILIILLINKFQPSPWLITISLSRRPNKSYSSEKSQSNISIRPINLEATVTVAHKSQHTTTSFDAAIDPLLPWPVLIRLHGAARLDRCLDLPLYRS